MKSFLRHVMMVFSCCLGEGEVLQAQEASIGSIVDQYIATKEKIKNNQLFSNTFNLNARKLSWQSSIVYQKTETYYYQFSGQGKIQLNLLRILTDSIASRYEIEYLYDPQGNLLYTYEKQNDPQYSYRELKVYFEGEKILKVLEDNVMVNSSAIFHSSKFRYIRESAYFYLQKFEDYFRLMPQY
ncbi:MAG: hypothetical protein NW226_21005 [Microscillaceae bacterium]|nr:hypothetical protein [Microscillaceae bacterium]